MVSICWCWPSERSEAIILTVMATLLVRAKRGRAVIIALLPSEARLLLRCIMLLSVFLDFTRCVPTFIFESPSREVSFARPQAELCPFLLSFYFQFVAIMVLIDAA